MNQDYSKAVSFINSYFALADGLVSGLENFLAEGVVLDWFGKTIKGRTNVAAFMNTHKVNSRHVFNDIIPTDSIGYNKKPSRRCRRRKSKIPTEFSSNGNISITDRLNIKTSTPENQIISSGDRSRSSSKIDAEGNRVEESDLTFELNDDALSNVFKLENIKSTNVEEIEKQINQICLEEKSNMDTSPRKRECKEINESGNISTLESSTKYVEAYGEILFSKRSRRLSGWNDCKILSSSPTHTWRKPCKLQIAYSSQKVCIGQVLPANNSIIALKCSSVITESQQKLLSLDQITELSSHLVPNVNDFAGYLRNINLAKEQDIFFKKLDEHMSKNEANKLGLVPRYIDGQLVFQKMSSGDQLDSQNSFIFNHLIHVIIYEGRSRCRINLSQKFI